MPRTTNRRGGGSGLLNQVTGLVGRTGGRGGKTGGGGMPGRAASFVAGFLSGGDSAKGKGKTRGRGGRGRAARRRR
jgi:hypothetical protein